MSSGFILREIGSINRIVREGAPHWRGAAGGLRQPATYAPSTITRFPVELLSRNGKIFW
jgi:hypothetical protein